MDNMKERTIQSSMLIEAEGSTFDELNQNKNEVNQNFYNKTLSNVFNQDINNYWTNGNQDSIQ